MTEIAAWGATASDQPLAPLSIERRTLRPEDVAIDIKFCGVCHSDLHKVRNEWRNTSYPLVPGHEIVGVVREVGAQVSGFAPGDQVAVGCLVDSCLACDQCHDHKEQYCANGVTMTYGGRDRQDGSPTQGGYSRMIVVRQEFVLRVPPELHLERAGPLLCAGITSYSPLRGARIGGGKKVGVVGLGGLGHMGVKLAAAMGAEVTVITTSPGKAADARALGASHVLVSTDPASMKSAAASFDLVIDTVPVPHEVAPYIELLKPEGELAIVGVSDTIRIQTGVLVAGGRKVSGSMIGGIAQTQEMLDFCAEMQILPDCETIPMEEINRAYERMERSDVKYRFVIDMSTL